MLIDMKKLLDKKTSRDEAQAEGFEEAKGMEDAENVSIRRCIIKGRLRYDKEDYEGAQTWFRKAAEAGSADAALLLGRMLYEEIDIEYGDSENFESSECFSWLKKAYDAGCQEAAQLLGEIYCSIAEPDPEKGDYWYFASSGCTDPEILCRVAGAYRESCGILPDYCDFYWDEDYGEYSEETRQSILEDRKAFLNRAFELYSQAAGRGSWEGELGLGELFCNREFSGCDRTKAVEHFLKAAERGGAEGYIKAAKLKREDGDCKGAEVLYRKAAKEGIEDAMTGLAELLDRDAEGSRQEEAAQWYLRAASLGDSAGLYEAGRRLVEGRGVKRDVARGARYLLDAAEGRYDSQDICELLKPFCEQLGAEEKFRLRELLDECEKEKESRFDYEALLSKIPKRGQQEEQEEPCVECALPSGEDEGSWLGDLDRILSGDSEDEDE